MTATGLLENLAARTGWAVLHSLWQGTLLGLVAFVVLLMVRNAAARHSIGFVALLGMGALFFANITRSTNRAATQEPHATHAGTAEGIFAADDGESSAAANSAEPLSHSPPPAVTGPATDSADRRDADGDSSADSVSTKSIGGYLRPLIPWIAVFWLFGVVLLSLRQLGGWWYLRQWRRHGVSTAPQAIRGLAHRVRSRLAIACDVPVFISERLVAPLLAGVVKPAVLLPLALVNGLKQNEVEAILAHELAHFRRKDSWANLIQIGIETLLFYHPVVWWLGRKIRQEREHAADDLALRSGTRRETYVTALAAVAGFQSGARAAGPALAVTGGSVPNRIRRLLAPRSKQATKPALAGLAGGFALAVATVAMVIGQLSSGVAQEEKESPSGRRIEVGLGDSIQAAIDAADDGDTIVLAAGIYPERIYIGRPNDVGRLRLGQDSDRTDHACRQETHSDDLRSRRIKSDSSRTHGEDRESSEARRQGLPRGRG